MNAHKLTLRIWGRVYLGNVIIYATDAQRENLIQLLNEAGLSLTTKKVINDEAGVQVI